MGYNTYMYCKLLDKKCVEEKCPLYDKDAFVCEIERKLGATLYRPLTLMDLSNFIILLEEIRPEIRNTNEQM